MKQKVLVAVLIVLGVGLTLFFGLRAFHAFGRIRERRPPPPVMDVELIRGWMTIPFIARGYQVPAPYLFDALGIPAANNHRKSLDDLNKIYPPDTPDTLLAQVKAAILSYRESHPPAPGGPQSPPSSSTEPAPK